MSFMLLGILNSQVDAGGGAYELIESNILASSASSVTFSSIPQDYKHLQIRAVTASSRAATGAILGLNFNADTGANYYYHRLYGNGSSVTSTGASLSYAYAGAVNAATATPSQAFTGLVIDILDYTNTSKNSTIRSLWGNSSSSPNVALSSGLWVNTSAITSILIEEKNSSNLITGSRFSLYGIRG